MYLFSSMKSSFSRAWFCKVLSPLKQLLVAGEIKAWRPRVSVCCCSSCALGATEGTVTTGTLSLPWDVAQSTVTYNWWQLFGVEGAFPPCLHHSHLLCHLWHPASKRNRRLSRAIRASQRYLTWKIPKQSNKPVLLYAWSDSLSFSKICEEKTWGFVTYWKKQIY